MHPEGNEAGEMAGKPGKSLRVLGLFGQKEDGSEFCTFLRRGVLSSSPWDPVAQHSSMGMAQSCTRAASGSTLGIIALPKG